MLHPCNVNLSCVGCPSRFCKLQINLIFCLNRQISRHRIPNSARCLKLHSRLAHTFLYFAAFCSGYATFHLVALSLNNKHFNSLLVSFYFSGWLRRNRCYIQWEYNVSKRPMQTLYRHGANTPQIAHVRAVRESFAKFLLLRGSYFYLFRNANWANEGQLAF